MSNRELFVSQSNIFGGFQKSFEKAEYMILGVPYDATSTYRTGSRFGPNAIRSASLNIETYSFRANIDLEDLKMHDLGDLHVSSDATKTVKNLSLVTRDVMEAQRTLVTIGGEHTITLGVIKGLHKTARETGVISFDAHLDLRNEFEGLRLSHTTFMRRVNEETRPAKIVEIGTRAVCKEELAYARTAGIEFYTAQCVKSIGTDKITMELEKKLAKCKSIYLSVDVDVLDPAYAPAAQNPEPEGLDPKCLLDILCGIADERVKGLDVVEVAPNYDQGITAIHAAKVIFEVLSALEAPRKSRKNPTRPRHDH